MKTIISVAGYILSWKSKRLSAETIKPPATSDNSKFFKTTSFKHSKHLHCLWASCIGSNNSDPTLKDCLFGAATLTKNADIDKYGYSGYGIGFDRRSSFSFPGGGFGQNVLMFGADVSFSTHMDNKKKDKSVLRNRPRQGLEHTLTAEKMYSINFTVTKKEILFKFALQWSK